MNNDRHIKELKLIRNIASVEMRYRKAAEHRQVMEEKLNAARERESVIKNRYVKLLCDLDQLRESAGNSEDICCRWYCNE